MPPQLTDDVVEVPPTGTSKEDIVDLLNDDDDNETEIIDLKDDKKTKETSTDDKTEDDKEESEETEETDELAELEEELQGPKDEDLDLVTPVRRKEILAKYPKLFKDFPYLEKAYYREQAFTELLPTIADARVAVEKSGALDNFENQLMTGSTVEVLKAVKENNEQAFHKLVDNYIPNLARVDKNAADTVVTNIVKQIQIAMVSEARNSGNEALGSAAVLLNQFIFGDSNFKPPVTLAREEVRNPEADNFRRQQQEFMAEKFNTGLSELTTRIDNALTATIEVNIDPKESMSDYVKKNSIRDALTTVKELITKDTRFNSLKDKLWLKARDNNFSKASLDEIRSAYISRARTLLPTVIKQARNEAMKGIGSRSKSDKEDKSPVRPGRPAPTRNEGSKKEIPKGMSTKDYFMMD